MKACPRPPRSAVPLGPAATAALLALSLALPVSCSLGADGLPPAGTGGSKQTSSSSGSGQGGDIFSSASSAASGGAGGATSSSSGATSSSSGATSSSSGAGGAGGGPTAVWHSWDVQTTGTPPYVIDIETGSAHPATLTFYQSITLTDLGVSAPLDSFNSGLHPDSFNNVQDYCTNMGMPKYPYVGKSSSPRSVSEINVPQPLVVYDLQVFPPSDKTKSVVAAFIVPFDADYTLVELYAHRVTSTADHAHLAVYTDNTLVKMTDLTATMDQHWVADKMAPHSLGPLTMGTHINFAVDSAGDNAMGDATEIAWTLTAK